VGRLPCPGSQSRRAPGCGFARIEADGFGEVLEVSGGASPVMAGENCKSVTKRTQSAHGVFRQGCVFRMGACVFVVAFVEQGDSEVEAFLAGVEFGFLFRDFCWYAGAHVHTDALCQIRGAGGSNWLNAAEGLCRTCRPA